MTVLPLAPRHRAAAAAGATVLALALLAGCGADPAERLPDAADVDLEGGSIAADVDLSGASLTVSSKEFTENVILGKITLYALRAAGAEAEDKTGLMGSTIVRKAQLDGEIDLYWDYAGTGWTQYLKEDEVITDGTEQFELTAKRDLAENSVEWLGPARFGNQYAIARASDAPGPVGEVDDLARLGRLAREQPDHATFCGAAEFMDREWERFQASYDAPFDVANVYQMSLSLNYVNVAKGSPCTFAEVTTTDARLESLDLKVLDDPEGYFTTQLAAMTARGETVEEHPELRTLAKDLGDALTEDAIIELNGMVDLDGATHDQAALYFLAENGFIG
ncbi:osmoprotectant transport system substrate-binding protein [Murinocardiopsis flavida]|uniref:Osmoprotectant transport system substrate-binding protein n=1 Tax=Murinocardiopsis flavida TaxID=645275 RepID=A0A2P8DQR5_9ACTN|nr:glycine betaine ABC transporter substrate-binding protein [Murinocardiopsis flavida]PSK99561.1 osmoprotectant transport system substrate-binding protein [Murinocardiopsis flavida]